MTGLLSPNSSVIGHLLCTILVVYIGDGMFDPVAVLLFALNQVLG